MAYGSLSPILKKGHGHPYNAMLNIASPKTLSRKNSAPSSARMNVVENPLERELSLPLLVTTPAVRESSAKSLHVPGSPAFSVNSMPLSPIPREGSGVVRPESQVGRESTQLSIPVVTSALGHREGSGRHSLSPAADKPGSKLKPGSSQTKMESKSQSKLVPIVKEKSSTGLTTTEVEVEGGKHLSKQDAFQKEEGGHSSQLASHSSSHNTAVDAQSKDDHLDSIPGTANSSSKGQHSSHWSVAEQGQRSADIASTYSNEMEGPRSKERANKQSVERDGQESANQARTHSAVDVQQGNNSISDEQDSAKVENIQSSHTISAASLEPEERIQSQSALNGHLGDQKDTNNLNTDRSMSADESQCTQLSMLPPPPPPMTSMSLKEISQLSFRTTDSDKLVTYSRVCMLSWFTTFHMLV